MSQLYFIDLFCGCGGFSLGLERAGLGGLAAIDSNPEAVAVFQKNLPQIPYVLQKKLEEFPPQELARLMQIDRVDVIVGGPPCQGFSKVRRVDGANNGRRLVEDNRRILYREFLRYVEFFRPKVFVMENVLGLRTAAGGAYFTAVQKEARQLAQKSRQRGYRVHGQIEDAWELGVPQKRRRQLIIGVRNDLPGYFLPELQPATRAEPRTWLWAAIGDLPVLRADGGEDECEYDFDRRVEHVEHQGNSALRYLCDVLEIDRAAKLTNHTARPHSARDLRDFARLREGESSAAAMRRGVQFEFPYRKDHFKDRYTRQSRWKPCSTIVAHLSKDGLMFIHPTQNRSLTPREAARVQSFPVWFRFPSSRTQLYRLIGNAVPPLTAEAVGLAVKEFVGGPTSGPARIETNRGMRKHAGSETGAPPSRHAAARELERLAQLDPRALRALLTEEFLSSWHTLLFLFPGLHPNNVLDHGDDIEEVPTAQLCLTALDELVARSCWAEALELIGNPSLN